MKLLCPKCDNAIASADVNMQESIAYCKYCDEYFNVAEHIKSDAIVVRHEKPASSKVQIERQNDSTVLIFPRFAQAGTGIFFILFGTVWTGISGLMSFLADEVFITAFLSFFVLVGLAVLAMGIYSLFVKSTLEINESGITIERNILGFKLVKKIGLHEIESIKEQVIYTQNNQPEFGIGIILKSGKSIKVGAGLTGDERKWLVGEMHHLKRNYEGGNLLAQF